MRFLACSPALRTCLSRPCSAKSSGLSICNYCLAGKDLSFVFTDVDPNNHARQFAFGVTVQEGQTYAGMTWSSCMCLLFYVCHLSVGLDFFCGAMQ